jgi:UDP-2,3-diacylglucosamine hydrolase
VQPGKKIYFSSDYHLGVPNSSDSLKREKKIVRWLEMAQKDAQEIFLMGDIFDFWFEYKHAIPKGFTRIQGKVAEITDSGIPVHFFIGNHDMWMFDYFEKELGVIMHRKHGPREIGEKKFFLGHGDGLGPGDNGYKFIKKVFANRFCQWCFARIHPNFGIGMANYWSRRSRSKNKEPQKFLGADKEWLITYCNKKLEDNHYDYFIFGHRHWPIEHQLQNGSSYINLGDWLQHCTYAVFDGKKVELKKFED